MSAPLLELDGVCLEYPGRRVGLRARSAPTAAVRDVSFEIGPGEVLGLVGESGSGKSSIGRLITRQHDLTSGAIRFDGADISRTRGGALRRLRTEIQIVFQDPFASLNPRMTAGTAIAEPLVIHGVLEGRAAIDRRVHELLEMVGLNAAFADRLPLELSGGQRQRVGIARAIALNPRLVVADEPVSALDVSVQAQILLLLQSLQRDLGLAYLFIAHDLAVVRSLSNRIAVMRAGAIVEIGSSDQICVEPKHPYTKALLAAVLPPDPPDGRPQRRPAPPAPVDVGLPDAEKVDVHRTAPRTTASRSGRLLARVDSPHPTSPQEGS